MGWSTNGLGSHVLVQGIASTLPINRPIEIRVHRLQIEAARNSISGVVQRQGVVLPVVIPHHALERGQISNGGLVTTEDFGTSTDLEIGGSRINLGALFISAHFVDERIEGDVVARPVSELENTSLVSALAITRHLLDNPEGIVLQRLTRGKLVVIDNHPLIVVGSRVVLNENLGPRFSVFGHTVGSDHTNPVQQALGDNVFVQRHVHHNQGSFNGHQTAVHLVIIITRGKGTRGGRERDSGGLGGGVVQVEGVGFEDPEHGGVVVPSHVTGKELREVGGHLDQSGAMGGLMEAVAELGLGERKPISSLLRGHEGVVDVVEITVSLEAKKFDHVQLFSGGWVSEFVVGFEHSIHLEKKKGETDIKRILQICKGKENTWA